MCVTAIALVVPACLSTASEALGRGAARVPAPRIVPGRIPGGWAVTEARVTRYRVPVQDLRLGPDATAERGPAIAFGTFDQETGWTLGERSRRW